MVTFIGMGLLGSNFTKAMIKKGIDVQVWNRSPVKAKALEADGAKAFGNVADAVKGADTVHVTLKDDASVDEVLKAAQAGLKPGTVIIDHTTTSVEGAVKRTKEWKELGFTYLHAPVFMGPQNALESTGYMMVSGDQSVITKQEPTLSQLTGKLINLGPEEGKAAAMKLVGNSFLVTFTAGIADVFSLAKALNVHSDEVNALFSAWNPAASLPVRMKKLSSGSYDNPSWELNMARKDTGLFLEAAKRAGTKLAVIPAIAEEMDKWIKAGYGNKDWTVIGKDSVS